MQAAVPDAEPVRQFVHIKCVASSAALQRNPGAGYGIVFGVVVLQANPQMIRHRVQLVIGESRPGQP